MINIIIKIMLTIEMTDVTKRIMIWIAVTVTTVIIMIIIIIINPFYIEGYA